jgi:ABC-type sugar transport system permease subunit
VRVDDEAAVRALETMRDSIWRDGAVPPEVLTWDEEDARFAFQNGRALFMRNWPYAGPLLADAARSRVAGRFAVTPFPAAAGGRASGTLGGQALVVNRSTDRPAEARALVAFLTSEERMIERARVLGEWPARRSTYGELGSALPVDAGAALDVVAHGVARPASPLWSQLSEILQVQLHAALTRQREPRTALAAAASDMRAALERSGLAEGPPPLRPPPSEPAETRALALILVALAIGGGAMAARLAARRDERLSWAFLAPALAAIAVVAVAPLVWTFWESFHLHDLRMPWRGRPWVGLANYREALGDARFLGAVVHTVAFAATTVTVELVLGLAAALALHRASTASGAVRTAVLLPWAIPSVAAAMVFRFLFSGSGLALHPILAWVPIVVADVWKTTPFVTLILLAGLQSIDPSLLEAAATDGAGPWHRFVHVTLPLLRPTIAVALLFRSLDALRLFDLVWVLTGGGPGTATEPVALLAYRAILGNLRFGYGSAISSLVFLATFAGALLAVRALGAGLVREEHA